MFRTTSLLSNLVLFSWFLRALAATTLFTVEEWPEDGQYHSPHNDQCEITCIHPKNAAKNPSHKRDSAPYGSQRPELTVDSGGNDQRAPGCDKQPGNYQEHASQESDNSKYQEVEQRNRQKTQHVRKHHAQRYAEVPLLCQGQPADSARSDIRGHGGRCDHRENDEQPGSPVHRLPESDWVPGLNGRRMDM